MRCIWMPSVIILFCLLCATPAYAADGATIIFDSGTAVQINNGYKQIIDSLREFNRTGKSTYVEITVEGSSFLINLEEITVICRDACPNLKILNSKK